MHADAKESTRRLARGATSLAFYLLRVAVLLWALSALARRGIAAQEDLWWHDTLLSLVFQLDVYRSLFYALLPAGLVLLFAPNLRRLQPPSWVLLLLAIAVPAACCSLAWYAPGWTRPGLELDRMPRGPLIVLGMNLAGLIWFHVGNRWTPRLRAIVVRAALLADLLFPVLLWSAHRNGHPRLFALPRVLPAALLCGLPLVPWLGSPLEQYQAVAVDPALERIDEGVYYQALYDPVGNALLLLDEHGALVRRNLDDGSSVRRESGDLRGVQAAALDYDSQRLLYISTTRHSVVLDARTLEPLRISTFKHKVEGTYAGCRTHYDAQRGLVYCSCDGASVSLCADGRTLIAQRPTQLQSDAQLDPLRNETHLLAWFGRQRVLAALSLPRLDILRQRPLPAMADRLAVDPNAERLFVSFPVAGRVMQLDRRDYRTLRDCGAFIGVRAMAIDAKRGWLLLSGLSPFLEIRSSDDLSLIVRIAAPYWTRWIELDSKHDRAFITSATLGVWSLDLAQLEQRVAQQGPPLPDPFHKLAVALGAVIQQALTAEASQPAQLNPRDMRIYDGQCPEGPWTAAESVDDDVAALAVGQSAEADRALP
ncbi:MAG: hypothetical protein P9M14_03800 [Candidatus Alcyoniella australis]|nr:hypothetical protein [Candidatus Alcyoniella australis]